MNADQTSPSPASSARRRARRCRIIGVIIVLLGLGGAGVVYWLGSRAMNYSDDPSMVGFDRAEQRQMAMLYGKQGQLIEDLESSLKQPGTQAFLIAAAAAVIALGCFYFARILEDEARQAELDGPHHV
jgi:hypothetical protein